MTYPSAAILRAYRLSRYVAGSVVAHIGSFPQGLAADRTRVTLVLLGACNPGGRRYPDGWNARMMDRMRLALRRFHYIEAAGSLDRWSEEMLMVSIDPRQACVIARRFRQNAIVLISGRRRTRLLIIAEKIPNITE